LDILTQIGLPVVTLTIMIFGLVSLVLLPILPSLVIMWAGALLFGLVDGFHNAGSIIFFVLISLLMIAGSLVDNLLMGASARRTGASWGTITLALIAGMVGSFVIPVIGGILFSLAALFLLELLRQHDWRTALGSTRSMAVGCGWAVVMRFGMGLAMIGLYVGWLFLAR
jgi:uncharacterized protein